MVLKQPPVVLLIQHGEVHLFKFDCVVLFVLKPAVALRVMRGYSQLGLLLSLLSASQHQQSGVLQCL